MSPPLVLFDDDAARGWRPFTTTRPAGELLFGTATLRARAERALGLECVGHVAPGLDGFDEPWAPPVLGADRLSADDLSADDGSESANAANAGGLVLLSSRFVAETTADGSPLPDAPALLTCDDRVVGCRLGSDHALPDASFFADPDADPPDLPRHELAGRVLDRVWELMSGSADRVARDLAGVHHAELPPDVHLLGDGPVSLGDGVTLAPGIVLDTRDGPIRIDDGVTVEPFTELAGPAYIGPGSRLLGGPFYAPSIGPVCKVHGEIEESVILGYSNKVHDGFLGHAYMGMWVNLGALTTNSDLKNNYSTVRLWTPDGPVNTGRRKIGCFLGDHVKTAIGTLLNTGTVIGTGSNIFPTGSGRMPPKYVPPFSWGDADTVHDLDRFLDTAATVMARRDVELSDSQRAMLSQVWHAR